MSVFLYTNIFLHCNWILCSFLIVALIYLVLLFTALGLTKVMLEQMNCCHKNPFASAVFQSLVLVQRLCVELGGLASHILVVPNECATQINKNILPANNEHYPISMTNSSLLTKYITTYNCLAAQFQTQF